jgi:hypothetical protein
MSIPGKAETFFKGKVRDRMTREKFREVLEDIVADGQWTAR